MKPRDKAPARIEPSAPSRAPGGRGHVWTMRRLPHGPCTTPCALPTRPRVRLHAHSPRPWVERTPTSRVPIHCLRLQRIDLLRVADLKPLQAHRGYRAAIVSECRATSIVPARSEWVAAASAGAMATLPTARSSETCRPWRPISATITHMLCIPSRGLVALCKRALSMFETRANTRSSEAKSIRASWSLNPSVRAARTERSQGKPALIAMANHVRSG